MNIDNYNELVLKTHRFLNQALNIKKSKEYESVTNILKELGICVRDENGNKISNEILAHRYIDKAIELDVKYHNDTIFKIEKAMDIW